MEQATHEGPELQRQRKGLAPQAGSHTPCTEIKESDPKEDSMRRRE